MFLQCQWIPIEFNLLAHFLECLLRLREEMGVKHMIYFIPRFISSLEYKDMGLIMTYFVIL